LGFPRRKQCEDFARGLWIGSGQRRNHASEDTVAGGYGSRLRPFSKITRVVAGVKRRFHDLPSVHLAYVAALASRASHEVVASRGELVDGDIAIVLSSLVGGVIGAILIASRRGGMATRVPYGTMLAAAALVASLYGDRLLAWYLGLMQV